jgi:hypothetical protein
VSVELSDELEQPTTSPRVATDAAIRTNGRRVIDWRCMG